MARKDNARHAPGADSREPSLAASSSAAGPRHRPSWGPCWSRPSRSSPVCSLSAARLRPTPRRPRPTSAVGDRVDTDGGTLHALALGPVVTWDPQRIASRDDVAFAGRVFARSLTAYAPNTDPDQQARLVGDLATTTGTASKDLKTWSFTLRDGAALAGRQPGDLRRPRVRHLAHLRHRRRSRAAPPTRSRCSPSRASPTAPAPTPAPTPPARRPRPPRRRSTRPSAARARRSPSR